MENNKGAKVSLNSISSLFCDAWDLYQARFTTLSEIILLPVLGMLLGYALIFLGSPFSALGVLVLIASVIMVIFSQLALVFSIHHNTGVDDSYRQTMHFFWSYIWMSILAVFAVLGGGVMLIIPGIWLAIALSLKTYTVVLEKRKGIDALRQSKDYIKGYWWAVVGRTILLAIVFMVISIIIHTPFWLIGLKGLGNLVSSLVTLFILPFAVIFLYKIYENLRTLKPEVADAPRSSNTFIKISAIIGVAAAILIIIATILAIGILVTDYQNGYFSNQNLPSNMNKLNNY